MTEKSLIEPHHDGNEMVALSAVMFNGDWAKDEAFVRLRPSDFYNVRNTLIAEAVEQLRAKGADVSLASIQEHLKEGGVLEMAGGNAWLIEVLETLPCRDVEEFRVTCKLIRTHAEARALHYSWTGLDVSSLRGLQRHFEGALQRVKNVIALMEADRFRYRASEGRDADDDFLRGLQDRYRAE